MKFSISKQIIVNILSYLYQFTNKKDDSDITSHTVLIVKNGELSAKATDYEIGLKISSSEINVESEGVANANGKSLLEVVKNLNSKDEIVFEVKNSDLIIKQKRTRYKLPMFDSDEFPPFPDFEELEKIDINASKIVNSFKKIIPAVDSNNPKYELNGALIESNEGLINIVGTDTKRLALISFSTPSQNEFSLIIPKKAILEIQKLFSALGGEVEIFSNETEIVIKSDNFIFFSKLINGKYPQYKRIIPKEFKHSVLLSKNDIEEKIKQVSVFSNEVKLTFFNDKILFKNVAEEQDAETELSLLGEDEVSKTSLGFDEDGFSIALNSKHVMDFLGKTDEETFKFSLNDSNLPFQLENSTENFITIIMPIIF